MCDTCPVCLDVFDDNKKFKEDNIKTLSCGHKLHFRCYRDLFLEDLIIL